MSESRRPPLVLVVEDNELNLELVQFLLEEAGVLVEVARDPDEARRAPELPDVVLMDMSLPGTDGLTLVRQLRARPGWGAVPVVAVTAQAMRGDRERFLAGGCAGYISKPIDPLRFVDTVLSYAREGQAP